MLYHGTDIDGPSFDPDDLNVRGRSLNELIQTIGYVEALYYLFAGRMPSAAEAHELETFLLRAAAIVPKEHPMLAVTRMTAKSGANPSRAMSAGLMVECSELLGRLRAESPLPEFGEELEDALFYFALPPLLLAASLYPNDDDPGRAFRADSDYLGAVYSAAAKRPLGDGAGRRLFDAVMVSFHAGFGVFPPTVQLPRSAVGSGAPIPQAIAAGYATAGPNHAGACEEAMKLLSRIAAGTGDLRRRVEELVDGELAGGRVVFGFGHPLFEADPRPPVIRAMADRYGLDSPYLEIYDTMKAVVFDRLGVHPNLDSISGTVYLSVGIEPAGGTGLFLCSRTAAMVAHALERPAAKPAFGMKSRIARKILKATPKEDFAFSTF